MNTLLLDLLAFGAVVAGIFVIISRNPIVSVLCLIAVFVNVACYLVLLGMSFIGLTYLIIYVGAIAILFLFVIIMINLKLASLEAAQGIRYNTHPLAFILTGVLFMSIVMFSVTDIKPLLVNLFDFLNLSVFSQNSYNDILMVFSMNFDWDTSFHHFNQLLSLGILMYTSLSTSLVYLAIVLLLAIIGPIVLTFRPANTDDSYLQRSPASSSISDKSATGKRSFSTSTRPCD